MAVCVFKRVREKLGERLIVFSPHPDDETLGCGGVIAKKLSEGYDIKVVIITDGRYAFYNVLGIKSNPTPDELKEIRKKEVKKALRILGVEEGNILFLDFVDGSLKDYQKEFENKIIEILSKYSPNEVFIPHKNDGHIDHRIANKIIKEVVRKLGLRVRCYEYMITHKFARIGPIVDSLVNHLLRKNIVKVDVSRFLHLKEQAIQEFKSEIVVPLTHKRPVVSNAKKFLSKNETFILENL